jgi:hypothetical protein
MFGGEIIIFYPQILCILSDKAQTSHIHAHTTAPKKKAPNSKRAKCLNILVGMRGFEPPTPCPPDKCANQAALHPELCDFIYHLFELLSIVAEWTTLFF